MSQSGFYEARRHAEKTAIRKACVHVRATFTASGQSYGNRRLVAALASQGITVGRYKVRCLMWQERRKPVWKRKFVHTTDSRHDFPVAPNVLSGSSTRPRQTWLTPPISRIRTGTGWLYLAVVLDLFSRKVVGWAMVPAMLAKLVCDALHMAIQQRCAPPGLNVRSDRGSQYAREQYPALLTRHGFVCSMSRKGNGWDNAVTERFFLNLKTERVWQRNYTNHAEAKCDIAAYIGGSRTASVCTRYWAMCHPAFMNTIWQRNNLSLCSKLLDHYTQAELGEVENIPGLPPSGGIKIVEYVQ